MSDRDTFQAHFKQWQEEARYGDTFVAVRLAPWVGETRIGVSDLMNAQGTKDAAMVLFEACRPLAMSAYRAYMQQLIVGIGMSGITSAALDGMLDLAAEEEHRRAAQAVAHAVELQTQLAEAEARLDELRRLCRREGEEEEPFVSRAAIATAREVADTPGLGWWHRRPDGLVQGAADKETCERFVAEIGGRCWYGTEDERQ